MSVCSDPHQFFIYYIIRLKEKLSVVWEEWVERGGKRSSIGKWCFCLKCCRLPRAVESSSFLQSELPFSEAAKTQCYFGTVEMSLFASRQWFDSSGTALWDHWLILIIAHRKYIKDLYSSLSIFCYSSVMKQSGYINWQMHTWSMLLSFRNC